MTRNEAAIQCAQETYCDDSDDDIELDVNPEVSEADIGAWVRAWVFVHNDNIEEMLAENTGEVTK